MLARLLRSPMGWLLVQIVEYGLLAAFFRWVLPDTTPAWVGWPLFIGSVAFLVVVNIRIARRLFPDPDR